MNEARNTKLTKRELEVLNLMVEELTIQEIANSLFIGTETVKTHRKKMMYKLNAKNSVGIVVSAVRNGFFSL